MADFLLELQSEEIPARMQARARNELARLFAGVRQLLDAFSLYLYLAYTPSLNRVHAASQHC